MCAKQERLNGQIAAIRGRRLTDNPHPINTDDSRAWSQGHREITEAK